MGCAFINNKTQIQMNEVDISGEATNPHENDLNVTNILQVKSDDIVIIDSAKKSEKIQKKNDKSKTKIKKKTNNNIINRKIRSANNLEYNFSGPIISLLRNKVDNYNRKKN